MKLPIDFYDFLKFSPLDRSIEDNVFFIQSNNETLGIKSKGEFFEINYLTLDKKIAEETLRGAPALIEEWGSKLHRSKYLKGYSTIPCFSLILDYKDLKDVCLYLSSKMLNNDLIQNLN